MKSKGVTWTLRDSWTHPETIYGLKWIKRYNNPPSFGFRISVIRIRIHRIIRRHTIQHPKPLVLLLSMNVDKIFSVGDFVSNFSVSCERTLSNTRSVNDKNWGTKWQENSSLPLWGVTVRCRHVKVGPRGGVQVGVNVGLITKVRKQRKVLFWYIRYICHLIYHHRDITHYKGQNSEGRPIAGSKRRR